MISFISSLEVINVVVPKAKFEGRKAKSEGQQPDPNIFLSIAASVAYAATVNANGIKTLLASG